MKSTLLRGAANVLLVLITHALLHRPADSFQLWSNRLTRALSASRQDPNEPVHRRPQLAPTTTPTTTSTTTPAPQLELHFEINPNDLEQYQRQQQEHRDLNELSDLINQQSANGTLILEDLVNQFERNFNSARTAKTNQEEQQDLLDNRNESQQVHFREPAAPNEQQHLQTISADILTRDKSAQYVMSEASHQAPKVGDLRVSAYQDETTTGSSSGANDLLVEAPFPPELDPDRHIQYDTYSASIADDELDMKRAMTEQLLQRRLDQELDRVSSLSAGKTNSTKQKRIPGRESQNANSTANKAAAVLPLLTVSGARNVSAVSATTNRTGSSNSSATSLDDPASNLTSTYRSLGPTQAQARSMSGPSSRLPSSAKAPYASYNLFSQRSDANNKSPGANATLAPGDNQTAAPANKSAETDSSSPPNGTELVNSINKISSHLAGEDSRVEPTTAASRTVAAPTTTTTSTTTSTTTTPRPLTLVDQLQAYLNSGGTNFNSRLDQRDVLERVASKLGPVNDLVELDPLPSETHAATLQQKQPAMSERFFAGSSPSPQRRNSHEDRYLSVGEFDSSGGNQLNPIEFFSGPSENQMILPVRINEMRAPDLSNFVSSFPGESLPASNGVDVDIENTPAPVLHRKTIETLSSQIKSSDHNLLAASTNTMAVHQHRERSPAQQQQAALPNHQALNRGMSGTFAAALINVTAPMVLPLSASEAMEASMASLNKQHAQDAHRASAQQHLPPHRSGYYAISQPVHDSIYSRPMNQFRPTTPAPHDLADREGPSLLSAAERERMRIGDFHQSASMGTSTVPASQLASGFRSPPNQFQGGAQTTMMAASGWPSLAGYGHTTSLPTPASYLNGLEAATPSTTSLSPLSSSPAPSSTSSSASKFASSTPATPTGSSSATPTSSSNNRPSTAPGRGQTNSTGSVSSSPGITNGFITGSVVNTTLPATQIDLIQAATGSAPSAAGSISSQVVGGQQQQQAGPGKRLFNLTRVEHISAECSNDLIRTIIIFNGTFKGIIYSSGYVRDPNCLYINGTGKTRYDFSIRLNQCGTLGRQEIHSPSGPDEVRRRDQVMWNSLSIQYNPIIEQEWDEHFRVSCEYGSDFWKTISFSPFNVETNTGSPVVFTVDPPQCQMEILKGHGMVGPRQEAISGPVTVGDPLTLLIHMKSEKAGYDILVKNCIAHNGGQQKMQLIDSNGCVVNERFISPFRGTYNDNDLKHVTLYSYLKAFRFTGSPVLYLECEVHMCQSACPPQMCYWRRLSKRSLGQSLNGTRIGHNATSLGADMQLGLQELAGSVETSTATSVDSKVAGRRGRTGRQLKSDAESAQSTTSNSNNLSDKISLFQALEVRHERFPEPDAAATSLASRRAEQDKASDVYEANGAGISQLMCYQRVEIFAFLFTVASILLAAVSVTIGCYCRASSLKRQSMSHRLETSAAKIRYALQRHPLTNSLSLANSANMCYSPISSISSLASSSSSSSSSPPLASPVSSGGNNRGQLHSNFGPKNSSASTANSDTSAQLYATNSAKCDELARHDRRYCRPFDLAFAVQSNQSRPIAGGQKQLAPSCNINHERLLAAKLARRG